MTASSLTFIILNGKGAGNEPLRQAIHQLRAAGFALEVRVTWEKGDGQRYLQEAVDLNAETLIAGGGDGTINELAAALLQLPPEQRPALGILPLGTANDFATSAGIPEEMEQALRLAISGKATPVDVAQVNHRNYFINMATGGFGTRITRETPERLKSALGGISYVIHGLLNMDTLKASPCKLKGPDFNWQGDALVLAVGNGRQAGGGQRLCPDALINDGLLDISIITSGELFPALIHSLTSKENHPNRVTHSLPWVTISSEQEMTFNLDGEPLSGTEFHIEIIPGAILCRLPPHCQLLS